MTRARHLLLAATLAVLPAATAATATAQTAQPSWLGTTVFAAQAKLSSLGAPPAAVAYSPDGRDVLLARSSGPGSRQVRVVVARHDPRTGRLVARGTCLSFPASAGCGVLPDAPANVQEIVVSADGRAVHLVGSGVLTLARDTTTGTLTPSTAPCLPPAGTAGCQAGGPVVSLALPAAAGAPGYLADGATLRLVGRDATTGAPAFVAGPRACLSDAAVAGCTQAPGAGARGLRTTADGRHVYAPGLTGRDVTVFRATATDPTTLVAPASPLVVQDACPADEECLAPDALLSPDDRHLYLTHPVSSLEAPAPGVPPLAYAVGADGALTPLACGKDRCPQLVGPAAFSPAGDQVYGLAFGSASGETIGATLSLVTYARDAATGLLREKGAFGAGRVGDIVESAAEVPGSLAASPTGEWLLDSDLEVFHRRTVRPPTISVRGLPRRGSCARRDVALRITISGTSRDATRSTFALATIATTESGLSRGNRTTKARTFTLRVRRGRRLQMLVTISAPGKRGNDVEREVEFRFC